MIPLDRLVLGTAKLGMPWYGYHSTSRPTAQESIALIRHAWRCGIRRFDTALGYGDAVYLLDHAGIRGDFITCKCRSPLDETGPTMLRQEYGTWLVHNPTLAQITAGEIMGADRFGVSVYTVAEVEAARQLGIAPIQAPASCLNPAVDVEYGRAPFLQGVLLRDPNLAPTALARAVFDFHELCENTNIGWKTLALHSAYGERIVFGVSSIRQLDEVLASCAKPSPPEEVIAKARALASTVDATAALPSLWSKP